MRNALFALTLPVLLLPYGIASAQPVIDMVPPAPTIASAIEDATRIARIRITERNPVRSDLLQEGPVCGYSYTASVVEALKGSTAPFKIFSTEPALVRTLNHDYFVITFQQPKPSAQTIQAISDLARYDFAYQVRCLTSQTNYLPSYYQSIWAFDSDAEKQLGGEWLAAGIHKDGLFCGFVAQNTDQHVFKIERIRDGQQKKFVISWPDVERFVRTELTRPGAPNPSSGNPNPCILRP